MRPWGYVTFASPLECSLPITGDHSDSCGGPSHSSGYLHGAEVLKIKNRIPVIRKISLQRKISKQANNSTSQRRHLGMRFSRLEQVGVFPVPFFSSSPRTIKRNNNAHEAYFTHVFVAFITISRGKM